VGWIDIGAARSLRCTWHDDAPGEQQDGNIAWASPIWYRTA